MMCLVPTIEAMLGPEAEELVIPLQVICRANCRPGQLADFYTVMLRALTICEKHLGRRGKRRACFGPTWVSQPIRSVDLLTSLFNRPFPLRNLFSLLNVFISLALVICCVT